MITWLNPSISLCLAFGTCSCVPVYLILLILEPIYFSRPVCFNYNWGHQLFIRTFFESYDMCLMHQMRYLPIYFILYTNGHSPASFLLHWFKYVEKICLYLGIENAPLSGKQIWNSLDKYNCHSSSSRSYSAPVFLSATVITRFLRTSSKPADLIESRPRID